MREEQLLRQQLQADFEYNLQLMRERDSELAKYEAAVAELRTAINHLTAENSELKVRQFVYYACTCTESDHYHYSMCVCVCVGVTG